MIRGFNCSSPSFFNFLVTGRHPFLRYAQDNLARNLTKMRRKFGVEEFGFFVTSYIMPGDYRLLAQDQSAISFLPPPSLNNIFGLILNISPSPSIYRWDAPKVRVPKEF